MFLKIDQIIVKTIPWYLNIVLKLIMAHVPLTHLQWKRLGFYKQGRMEDPEYAKRVWKKYSKPPIPFPGWKLHSVLELGPGDGGYTFGYALARLQ